MHHNVYSLIIFTEHVKLLLSESQLGLLTMSIGILTISFLSWWRWDSLKTTSQEAAIESRSRLLLPTQCCVTVRWACAVLILLK